MKKLNKLFATLIAVLGVGSLSAQTDVTSLYLTNADFSSTSGWTQYVSSGYREIGSGNIGTFKVKSDVGTAATTDAIHLSSEYCFGFEVRWASNYSSYYQNTKTELPNGIYTLTFDIQNTNNATVAGDYESLCYVEVEGKKYTDTYVEWKNGGTSWTTHTINFIVNSASTAKISLGYGSGTTSNAHANTPTLYVSHLKLTHKLSSDVTEANPTDLTSIISNTKDAWAGATETPGYDGITMVAVYQEADWTGDALSQTINGLPAGNYNMEVYCQAHSSWDTDVAKEGATGYTYLCANEYRLDVPIRNADKATTKQLYTFEDMAITNGSLKISVINEKKAANWISIYVKSLTFLGPDKTLSENAFNENYATISNLDTNVPISAEFATEIQTLKSDFSGVSATELTQSQLDEANGRMQNVINEYDANIDAYAKLKTYIDMTKVFDETGTAPYEDKYNNRLFTLNEVESVRQELNVMRFNAASLIFTNKVDVTGWTGTMGERNDQHWSGNTVSYKDANSWGDIDPDALTTQITLPKGNYVLKVAGRAHANAALTLKVLGQTITFHGKGDTGYGIDTNGDANFSPNGTYANNGIGRGWEWEFLKFSLDAEQTITLEVNSGYNNNWQVWTSFGDITLWMDDATYVTVHGDAIYEPLATAKALVDTKPMGATANNALKNAIAQSEGTISTPAELDGAIEALNDAIRTAYAWLPLYNEAKVPLVEALERFEADFNNDEGNEPGYMKKGLWNTVIKEVQEAALAKDVTDSYDGFASAAFELNAALDAVRASIDMYANLKAEISYANNYAPMIAENIAGHTDAIATAQALYDAAEADDASAEILAMQNYRILDHNHVTDYIAEHNFEIKELTWSGQTNTDNREHWSGVTNAYFDYSKWSEGYIDGANEAIVTVTLSAGEYVLQAAGRVATVAGSEAYIKVNDTKVNFTAKGAYGYGIATDGTATFAKDATYARENEGFGWEYRSIMFSLTEDTEVTLVAGMTIDANTADLSWASVCTPVLYAHEYEYVEVDLTFSTTGWATLILPFDAELPEDMTAYSCHDTDGEVLELVENESIKANTPYLMKGQEGDNYLFSGYSLADKDSYTDGLFTGTYVEYQTQADGKTYVFQNNNGETAFYLVSEDEPIVQPYNCYIVCENAEGTPIFRLTRNGGTTNIDDAQLTNNNFELEIYDLMGRKVSSMEKGKMYIVNGVKVIVK